MSAGGDETPGAGGITPLCQQYRLGLAPTRIHSLKFNFSLIQLGAVEQSHSSEKSPATGVELYKNTAGLWGRIPVIPPKQAERQALNADEDLDGGALFKTVGN